MTETRKVIPGLSSDEHGTISADGKVAVQFFRLKAMESALRLEVTTGMKFSSRYSVAQLAREECGTKVRKKENVLIALQAHIAKFIEENGIDRNGN